MADADGDGVAEIVTMHRTSGSGDESRDWLIVRSGATGAEHWRRDVTDAHVVTSAAEEGPAVLLLEQRTEVRPAPLGETSQLVVDVLALAPDGGTLWQRTLRGAESGTVIDGRTSSTPLVEGVGDVTGDGAHDVVLAVVSYRRGVLSLLEPSTSFAYGVIDGSDGALTVAEGIAAERSFDPIGDLDGDGKGDVLERRSIAGVPHLAVLHGDGTEQWAAPEPVRPSRSAALAVADLDGDGDRDLLTATQTSRCGEDGCTYPNVGHARDGGSGALLRAWEGDLPHRAAQADADAAIELIGATVVRDSDAGLDGIVLEVADLTGDVSHRTERLFPTPALPWIRFVNLVPQGDVDADGVEDWAWEIGRYRGDYAEPPAYDDIGRVSGATGHALPSLGQIRWDRLVARFDGTGTDYLERDPPGPTLVFRAVDGYDASPVWESSDLVPGPNEGGYTLAGDLDGDERDEVLYDAYVMDGNPDGPRSQRQVLLDGATGAIRWDVVSAWSS